MPLTRLTIKNFKSIKYCDITLSDLNVLIGENGTGKTNLLDAISYFYYNLTGSNISTEIFDENNHYSNEVRISLTYDLSEFVKISKSNTEEIPDFGEEESLLHRVSYSSGLSCLTKYMDMPLDDRMYIVGCYARRAREYGLGPASFCQYVTHRSKRYIACSDFFQRSRCAHSPARPLKTGSAPLDSSLDFARLAFSARWHKRKTRPRRVFF